MAAPINWPLNPSPGDIYSSPHGEQWVYDGCTWVGTCCPPCSDGICIQLQYANVDKDTSAVNLVSLSIPLQPSPYPWPAGSYVATYGGGNLFAVVYVDGCWQLWNVGNDGGFAALLCGPSLLGLWDVADDAFGTGLVGASTVCGPCTPLCATITTSGDFGATYTIDMLQAQNGAGETFYVIIESALQVVWDTGLGQWVLIDADTSTVLAQLTGVTQAQLPVGISTDWVVVDPSVTSFSTAEGPCPCIPDTAGLTFLGTTTSGLTFTLAFTWDGTQYVSVYNPAYTIQLSAGTWTLYFGTPGGVAAYATATDPLGPWTPVPIVGYPNLTFVSADSYCGLAPFTYGCICGPGGTPCYSILRITTDAGLVFYSAPDDDVLIFYDSIAGSWSVQVSSVEVDVITSSSLGPWGTGPNGWSATPNQTACTTTPPTVSAVVVARYCYYVNATDIASSPVKSTYVAALTATASGGTPPYTFSWSGPGVVNVVSSTPTTENVQVSDNGIWVVTVVDSNLATANYSIDPTVPVPTGTLTLVGLGPAPFTYEYNFDLAFLAASPPAGTTYTYQWLNTSTSTIEHTDTGTDLLQSNYNTVACGTTYEVVITYGNRVSSCSVRYIFTSAACP